METDSKLCYPREQYVLFKEVEHLYCLNRIKKKASRKKCSHGLQTGLHN